MDLPLPPMHPKTPELLRRLKLRAVDVVKWNLLLCVKHDDSGNEPTHVLKFGIDERKSASVAYETRILHEVLPQFREDYFSTLILPELIGHGTIEGIGYSLTGYIKGQPLIHKWSELTFKGDILGGKPIDESVAPLVVNVLRDLRMVDIEDLPEFVRRFSVAEWLQDFEQRSQELVDAGLMERGAVDGAIGLFSDCQVERYQGSMFTNGDFYPRNMILLPNDRVAVVDWVGGIEPWSFVAMYCWLLMWGNPAWQAAYMRALKEHFPIDEREMQVGLLMKSFDLAYQWRDEPEINVGFARTQQLAYFHQCLDLDYVRQIFG